MPYKLLLLLLWISYFCTAALLCPVTYSNNDITIHGPCPIGNMIVPVGYTVQYRCDYESSLIPYWVVIRRAGSSFEVKTFINVGEVWDCLRITIDSTTTSNAGGHTKISITFLQHCLIEIVKLFCGVTPSDHTSKPLTQNHTSEKAVELAMYSIPSSLKQLYSDNIVTLSWSPPAVPTGYTDPVDFQYEVTLTNVINTSQLLQFTTNNTHLNISQLLVPDDHDICTNYTWSVLAEVEERQSEAVQSDESIFIPSVPVISDTHFSHCDKLVIVSVDFKGQSCSDTGQVNYTVSFRSDADQDIVVNSLLEMPSNDTHVYVIKSTFSVPSSVLNGTITVIVIDMFGPQTVEYRIEEGAVDGYHMCDETVTPSPAIVISNSTDIVTSTNDTIPNGSRHSNSPTTTPSVRASPPPDSVGLGLGLGIAAAVIIIGTLITAVVIIIFYWTHKKRQTTCHQNDVELCVHASERSSPSAGQQHQETDEVTNGQVYSIPKVDPFVDNVDSVDTSQPTSERVTALNDVPAKVSESVKDQFSGQEYEDSTKLQVTDDNSSAVNHGDSEKRVRNLPKQSVQRENDNHDDNGSYTHIPCFTSDGSSEQCEKTSEELSECEEG